MSSPPHPLFHFGMTGWWKIRGEETAYYNSAKPEEPGSEWPPKYWKFLLETAEEPKCESAFVDSRRFARIRLLECAAADIRQISPLKENGPDPVLDKETLTEEWLIEKMRGKKIPVKALLLDQANISGIGNWVGYELDCPKSIMYTDYMVGTKSCTAPPFIRSSIVTPSPMTRSKSYMNLYIMCARPQWRLRRIPVGFPRIG